MIKVNNNEPENVNDIDMKFCSVLKNIRTYYNETSSYLVDGNSSYYQDLVSTVNKAKNYIDSFLYSQDYLYMRMNNITPAIMSDMDDTIWCTYAEWIHKGYCYNPEKFLHEAIRQKMPPITPVLDLLSYCAINGIMPIFVTGRSATYSQADATIIQLNGLNFYPGRNFFGGMFGWNNRNSQDIKTEKVQSFRGVFFNPTTDPAHIHKPRTRKYIEDNGLPYIGRVKFIASMGDQDSDSSGVSSGMRIKLPNPLYTLP